MTLNDILHALDQLKADELTQVQKHLDHLQIQSSAGIPQETPADTIAALRQAFAAMREGLDEDDLQGLVDAMNQEYIETDIQSQYDWLGQDIQE